MDAELILTHPKVYPTERWVRKHYPEEIAKVMATPGTKFTEKLYNYLYHNPVHICPVCGAPTKFRNFIYGYSTYCSVDCSYQSKDRVQRIKSSVKEKYGVDNYSQTKQWKEQRAKTCMERYGTMNFFNNEKVKEKYGVDNYAKTPQWKEQRAKTCMERYGTKNFFNQDKIKQQYGGIGFGGTMVSKIKKTMMERYGTDCSMKAQDIKDKIRESIMEKYGVEHPMKVKDIKLKAVSAIKANQILKHDFLIGYTEDGDWICKCPHPDSCNKCQERTYITSPKLFAGRKKWFIEQCTRLLPKQSLFSTLEVKIRQWLDSWGVVYETNDRRFGQEMDIYIPELKLAIEVNGSYWHSTQHKTPLYHINKSLLLAEHGIRCVFIWDDYKETDIHEFLEAVIKGIDLSPWIEKWFPDIKDWPADFGLIEGQWQEYRCIRGEYECYDAGIIKKEG